MSQGSPVLQRFFEQYRVLSDLSRFIGGAVQAARPFRASVSADILKRTDGVDTARGKGVFIAVDQYRPQFFCAKGLGPSCPGGTATA